MLLPEYRWKEGKQLVASGNQPESGDNTASNFPVLPSQMLGPAYALYSLARNGKSRDLPPYDI